MCFVDSFVNNQMHQTHRDDKASPTWVRLRGMTKPSPWVRLRGMTKLSSDPSANVDCVRKLATTAEEEKSRNNLGPR